MGRAVFVISVFNLNNINQVPFKNLKALFGMFINTLVEFTTTELLSIIGIPFLLAKLNG